jgi:hypothetical protein
VARHRAVGRAEDFRMSERQSERMPLTKAAEFLLDECRMVLPGIQALFGFQLIAVFNDGFSTKLTARDQQLHLFAIGLVAIAVVLIMAPAAYSRQRGVREVTEGFLRIASRLLLISMLPLAIAICLDFYLIAGIIIGDAAAPLAGGLFAIFLLFWFALPRVRALERLMGSGDAS